MALNLGRWLKYAQAKVSGAVESGHRELDQLEAEREAELAERPWLASDGATPTLDEARARIEWEAEEQRRRAERDVADAAAAPASLPQSGDDADAAAARMELDRREQEAKARLDAIRDELGVDPDGPATPA
jgi:hypothetical protein